jgi:hypothetical protein
MINLTHNVSILNFIFTIMIYTVWWIKLDPLAYVLKKIKSKLDPTYIYFEFFKINLILFLFVFVYVYIYHSTRFTDHTSKWIALWLRPFFGPKWYT